MTIPDPPRLHVGFPALVETLPYRRLGHGPTPVQRLELDLPAEVWWKDDGAYGDGGWGGNKVRKLEWLIPDALRRGRRTILTVGGLGTNWGLAATLYGREAGLRTAIALVDQPVDAHVRAQLGRLEASGASLHRTHTKARTIATAPWLLLRHSSGLRPPYLLPAGGSSPVGSLGYVEAALELGEQVRSGALPEPAWVVVPVGSGGTTAGLTLGLEIAGLRTRVLGVVVNDTLRLDAPTLLRLSARTAEVLRERGAHAVPEPSADRLRVTTEFMGDGYGHPTVAARQALDRAAEVGLRLDPVYTAKAMAAVLGLLERGDLDGPILVVRTDGPR